LATSQNGLNSLNSKVATITSQTEAVDAKLVNLREWELNAKELKFNDDDFHCPTCARLKLVMLKVKGNAFTFKTKKIKCFN
jgi:hypothetical protein